jgi:hypothetical protein
MIEVAGRLEPKALAGRIASDAHERIAEAITLTIDRLEEDGRELNQLQRVELFGSVLTCVDGFERQVYDTLVEAFSRANERGDDGS